MATIRKRESAKGTSYQVQVRLKGYPTESASFERLTDARAWAAKIEADMKAGRHFGSAKRRTLGELLDRYEKHARPKLKSWEGVKARLDFWREKIGEGELLETLRPERLASIRDELKETPKQRGKGARSGADVNRTIAALSSALSYGVKELGWLERNPCERIAKLAESKGRVRFLDDDELPRFLAACRESSNPDLLLAVVLSITTGGRQSEIMGLRWPQIDLKRRLITLGETKNGDARALPLSGEAFDLLKERAKVRSLHDDRLFPPTAAAKKAEHLDLRAPFLSALERAGIKDFHWHDLRHCAASYLVMEGVDLVSVARILGHRQLQMTLRYAHLAPGQIVKHGDMLAARLGLAGSAK